MHKFFQKLDVEGGGRMSRLTRIKVLIIIIEILFTNQQSRCHRRNLETNVVSDYSTQLHAQKN